MAWHEPFFRGQAGNGNRFISPSSALYGSFPGHGGAHKSWPEVGITPPGVRGAEQVWTTTAGGGPAKQDLASQRKGVARCRAFAKPYAGAQLGRLARSPSGTAVFAMKAAGREIRAITASTPPIARPPALVARGRSCASFTRLGFSCSASTPPPYKQKTTSIESPRSRSLPPCERTLAGHRPLYGQPGRSDQTGANSAGSGGCGAAGLGPNRRSASQCRAWPVQILSSPHPPGCHGSAIPRYNGIDHAPRKIIAAQRTRCPDEGNASPGMVGPLCDPPSFSDEECGANRPGDFPLPWFLTPAPTGGLFFFFQLAERETVPWLRWQIPGASNNRSIGAANPAMLFRRPRALGPKPGPSRAALQPPRPGSCVIRRDFISGMRFLMQ